MSKASLPKKSFSFSRVNNDELDRENEYLKKYIALPDGETVKEFFPCTFMGGRVKRSTGKLYLACNYICFVGQKKFGGDTARVWSLRDILDLSAAGKSSLKILDIQNKTCTLAGFNGGEEGRDKALKSVKRLFFGFSGDNVLHAAVLGLELEKIKQICDLDVTKLAAYNANEQTPLILACAKNDKDLVTLLLNYYINNVDKIDINQTTEKSGHHVLHEVCKFSDISDDILKLILDFPSINVNTKLKHDNTTPLHYFCEHNHSLNCTSIGEILIEKGADVNARNSQQETPLHKAIFNTTVRVFMVRMLLKHKASADVKAGSRGDTPLHYAIIQGRKDLLKILLEAGADIHVKNNEGKDALDIAKHEYNNGLRPEIGPILAVLQQVQNVYEMLKKVELLQFLNTFIEQELYDPVVLSRLDEAQLMNLGIKTGPRIKLLRELQELRELLEHEQVENTELEKEKEKIRRKKEAQVALKSLLTETTNTEGIRQELGEEWEISHTELEFTAKLGQGGSGQVFKGLFRGRKVAIKVLFAENREEEVVEFKKEFQIFKSVKSRHIVQFFGISFEPRLCMVMEYAERGSLHELLKSGQPLQWDRAFSFASDMAQGLSDLHNHKPPVIHRDLKSLNLLVTKDWRIKVCDFGLSRSETPDQLATFHRLCGTFAYCAPEIFNGVKCTAKSDVFSMGIVLWELLSVVVTGKYETPYAEFDLSNQFQIIVQTAQGLRPTIPAGSPVPIVDLFKACVDAAPEARPTSKQVVSTIRRIKRAFAQGVDWATKHLPSEEKKRKSSDTAPKEKNGRVRVKRRAASDFDGSSRDASNESYDDPSFDETGNEPKKADGMESVESEEEKSPAKKPRGKKSELSSSTNVKHKSKRVVGKKEQDSVVQPQSYLSRSSGGLPISDSSASLKSSSLDAISPRTKSQQRLAQKKKH